MTPLKPKLKWAVTYLIGLLLAFVLDLGVMTRLIRIKGWDKFPHGKGGILLTPNHPSMLEAFLMIPLFYLGYLSQPKRLGPYTVSDTRNYNTHWFWSWFNLRLLAVCRPAEGASKEELKKATEINLNTVSVITMVLKELGNVIIFLEGGRTESDPKAEMLVTPKGNRMRRFKDTIGYSIKRSGATVVPVWSKATWGKWEYKWGMYTFALPKSIEITIGDPMTFDGVAVRDIGPKIQQAVLELADAS